MTVNTAKCIMVFATTFSQLFLKQTNAAPNPPRASLLVADWAQYNHQEPEGKGTYAFGYDVEDPATNNVQFRNEERHTNGTVTGSYGYLEPDGNIHMVHYIADKLGYRATVENSARGGMLKPIPVLQDDYFAYGYSPQMLAAMKSQQTYKQQKVHEQRQRPYDQLSEEEKLLRPNGVKEKFRDVQEQRKIITDAYPYFNYPHEDYLDFA